MTDYLAKLLARHGAHGVISLSKLVPALPTFGIPESELALMLGPPPFRFTAATIACCAAKAEQARDTRNWMQMFGIRRRKERYRAFHARPTQAQQRDLIVRSRAVTIMAYARWRRP